MFGDFSRFENNPELGVTGVYMSQGSPILDSAWNEQAAALSDWITLVGRMAAGDTFRRFEFDASLDDHVFKLSRGVAMVAGRVFQTREEIKAKWLKAQNAFDDSHVMAAGTIDSNLVAYFVAVEISDRSSSMTAAFHDTPPALRTRIDWKICFGAKAISIPDHPVSRNDVNLSHFRESAARSFGETRHLTPELELTWVQRDENLRRKLLGSTLALIECHSAATDRFVFKIASSPDNILVVDPQVLQQKEVVVQYRPGQCTVLDDLQSRGTTKLFVDLEGPQAAFQLAVDLFRDSVLKRDEPYEATVDPVARKIIFTMKDAPVREAGEWKLRIWNLKADSTDLGLFLVQSDPKPPDQDNGVRATFPAGSILLPGDRWYLPLQDGVPVSPGGARELRLPGHRVFRAIAKVRENDGNEIALTADGPVSVSASMPGPSSAAVVLSPLAAPAMASVEESTPVRRFDASFHRLTSALEAARELTRKTACKDLPIRVSYLPLRRWLASVSVHEIADLDLDGFLARIRRSLEVPPEEEHLLTEQASLVLEEASRLAGPLPVETIGSRFA